MRGLRLNPSRAATGWRSGAWISTCASLRRSDLGGRFATRVFSSEIAADVLASRAQALKPRLSIAAFPLRRARRWAPTVKEAPDKSCCRPLRRPRCQTRIRVEVLSLEGPRSWRLRTARKSWWEEKEAYRGSAARDTRSKYSPESAPETTQGTRDPSSVARKQSCSPFSTTTESFEFACNPTRVDRPR